MLGANIKEKTKPFWLGRGLGIIVKGDWRRRKEESFGVFRSRANPLREYSEAEGACEPEGETVGDSMKEETHEIPVST